MTLSDFTRGKCLGHGSSGTVYLATRNDDQKEYALKFIRFNALSLAEKKDSLNEIRIMSSVKHPHLVRYYEAFFDNDRLCIVTEYINGGDLQTLIDKLKKQRVYLKEEIIWRLFIEILIGLEYLHSHNILHRDVKSANIFLAKDGTAKLGDFGVCKVLRTADSLTMTSIGTPYYLSPELWENKPYNAKSDIWSLGCVLYEMTTLNKPFDAMNIQRLRQRVRVGKYQPIPSCYSSKLSNLISNLLTSNPRIRPSAAQVLEYNSVQNHMFLVPSFDRTSLTFDLQDQINLPNQEHKRKSIRLPPAQYDSNSPNPSNGSLSDAQSVTSTNRAPFERMRNPERRTKTKREREADDLESVYRPRVPISPSHKIGKERSKEQQRMINPNINPSRLQPLQYRDRRDSDPPVEKNDSAQSNDQGVNPPSSKRGSKNRKTQIPINSIDEEHVAEVNMTRPNSDRRQTITLPPSNAHACLSPSTNPQNAERFNAEDRGRRRSGKREISPYNQELKRRPPQHNLPQISRRKPSSLPPLNIEQSQQQILGEGG
ncbi:putative G2-specific protein kinase nimA [Blattamonas nauphoetae]|uniref:non-specific serine/threonine protein kinase n=1 Tax=Blattamonas nauphoetae TaxID=2049346 RepID=A0ABQ9XB45_9EUKA|nr:putative G2-specific protein kinase nimA [Blattamonas nauphoetae]